MAILKIARMGHPVLTRVAEPVSDPTAPEVARLIADMMQTVEDAGAAGLAAPQVHVPWRLFVFRVAGARAGETADDAEMALQAIINPVVTALDDEIALGWEGCLSIPGLKAVVPRAARIRYAGLDADGRPIERTASGFHARVVQHETDHLDGISVPDAHDRFLAVWLRRGVGAGGGPVLMRVVPFGPEHVADLLTWFASEAELVQWGGPGLRFPLDAAQMQSVLAEARAQPPTRLAWTGIVDASPCAHAEAALDMAQGVARLARVGIAPVRRGKGLALPFLREVVDRIWAMAAIERIELSVRPGNAAAVATYLRLGFVPEGVRRGATRVGRERWDIATFGMLRGGAAAGGEGFHARPTGHEFAAEAYPLSPLEAWFVMRGFGVRPAQRLTIEQFLELPGKLELADGYVVLWTA